MQADDIRECAEGLVNDFLSGLTGKRQADTPTLPSAPNFDLRELNGGAFEYGTLLYRSEL